MDQNAEARNELIQEALNNGRITEQEAAQLYDRQEREQEQNPERIAERIAAQGRLAQARQAARAAQDARVAEALARRARAAGQPIIDEDNINNNNRDPEDNNGIGGRRKSKRRKSKRRKSKRRSRKYFF